MRTKDATAGPTFGSSDGKNEARLKELIVYIVNKCGSDPKFGTTKLNKVLFFADFTSFARTGKAITGVEYMKLPKGPAPRRLLPVRDELVEIGDLRMTTKTLFSGIKQTRFFALREPALEGFTGEEIALVDEVIDYLREMTAEEVSNMSHGVPWELADPNGPIAYETVFLAKFELTEADVQRTHQLARERGWAFA